MIPRRLFIIFTNNTYVGEALAITVPYSELPMDKNGEFQRPERGPIAYMLISLQRHFHTPLN